MNVDVRIPYGSGPRPDRKSRQEGFSLLEVVFSLVLLTILTLSTLLVVIPISRQVRVSREMELATLESRKVLEKIQSTPFFDITTIYPDGTQITLPGLDNGQVTLNYADPTADPLFLTATLSWDSPDLGSMTRTFISVRTE